VEDDARMLDLLSQGLREAGHTVMPASDGQVALELALKFSFDLILLDLGLPSLSGYEVARQLRAQCEPRQAATPILMLTARDAEDDIIRGFDLGADDYLIKPFSFPELLARLNALARPTLTMPARQPLDLDPARLTVTRENRAIQLTRTEFLLLQSLVDCGGKTVSRRDLIHLVWGNEPVHANTLDVFINALRGKVDASFEVKLIVTERGVGYRVQIGAAARENGYSEMAG